MQENMKFENKWEKKISKIKVMEINSRSPTEINRTQNVRLNCLCFKRNLTKRNKKLKATKTDEGKYNVHGLEELTLLK